MRWGLLALVGSVALHLLAVLAMRPPSPVPAPAAHPPVELSLVEPPAPPSSPVVPALAARPAVGGVSRPRPRLDRGSAEAAVAVPEGDDGPASGSARFIEASGLGTGPTPRGLPPPPPATLARPARLDLDVTVGASGRVGGVVALGRSAEQLALAGWAVEALGRVRFAPATAEGSPVSTTIPVTLVLDAADGGSPGWEAAAVGYVLRL